MSEASKMLIDASHPEETRVVVVRGDRVEEFDYESRNKKLLRGNIYLAKVTRVEPSLQAAFVEYGGNRHGFLAFSDIHPDYYQIPVADRQALLAAEAEAAEDDDDDEPVVEPTEDVSDNGAPATDRADEASEDFAAAAEARLLEASNDSDGRRSEPLDRPNEDADGGNGEPSRGSLAASSDDDGERGSVVEVDTSDATETIESVGSEDVMEEVPRRRSRPLRSYKIQEVIKRRQILLIQVVKEERGTKGAALTTYLSLAGRYTVLMPNTNRGGGISRKITNATDRKRLKEIAVELEVPDGMGLIVRTAGAARTKQELKRDFEYLMRLWESVRDLTLRSSAPALVYEEGDLIKRSIRDLYTKDVEDIVVAGAEGFDSASDFMRMLMPSHSKNVKAYGEPAPLFTRYQVERQLNALFSPYVTLRSGGYIVINQTEALVSIDVNSGKATREHSIEDTALKTNLEASDEIARQLRLRDLAGLIVIDFIDMEERRNNRSVERRIKDALKNDRARIQVGRISHFGLLEMSRQRLRTGVLEGSTSQCPHCQGSGVIRSTESVALSVLRALEDTLLTGQRSDLAVTTSIEAALYILNAKRDYLADIEQRHGMRIAINASDKLHGANYQIERTAAVEPRREKRPAQSAVQFEWGFSDDAAEDTAEVREEAAPRSERVERSERADRSERGDRAESGERSERGERRPRRRRRGRGGEGRPLDDTIEAGSAGADDADERPSRETDLTEIETVGGDDGRSSTTDFDHDGGDEQQPRAHANGEDEGERGERRTRRRGRRGGRRNRRSREPGGEAGSRFEADANGGGDGFTDNGSEARSEPDAAASNGTEREHGQSEERRDHRRPRRGQRRERETIETEGLAPVATADPTMGRSEDRPRDYSHASGAHSAVDPDLMAPPWLTAEAEPRHGRAIARESADERRRPEVVAEAVVPAAAAIASVSDDPPSPPKRGWWQRKT